MYIHILTFLLLQLEFHSGSVTTCETSCNVDDECCTPECLEAAATLIASMNTSVDPCDDFYEFTCGGFIRSTNLSELDYKVDRYSLLQQNIDASLMKLLNQSISIEDPRPLRLMKTLFGVCMDEEEINKNSTNDLKNLLNELGGWPTLSPSWNQSEFSIEREFIRLHRKGFSEDTFFKVYLSYASGGGYAFELTTPPFILNSHIFSKGLENVYVEAYYNLMWNVVVALGGNETTAKDDMRKVLDFEIELAKLSLEIFPTTNNDMDLVNSHNKTLPNISSEGLGSDDYSTDPLTIGDYNGHGILMYPSFPLRNISDYLPGVLWIEILEELFTPYYKFSLNETVILSASYYYENLGKLLSTAGKRTQGNYLFWKFVYQILPTLSNEIMQIKLQYQNITEGITQTRPRPEICTRRVKKSFSVGMSSLYVDKLFNDSMKASATHFATFFRQQLIKSINNITWMDNYTRENAMIKAEKMKFGVAYPDAIRNTTYIESFYSQLNLTEGSYLENFLKVNKFDMMEALRDIFETREDLLFSQRVINVDAYYLREENEIAIPAAILQPMFYGMNRTWYLNFAGLGRMLGHEFTHGFDKNCRYYDWDGSFRDWWDDVTERIYEERSQCFVDLYGNVTVEQLDMHINGLLTLSENLADNVGMKEAYTAYKEWVRQNGSEKKLPGLSYTPEQLFWIQYGSTNCEKSHDYYVRYQLQEETHAPSKYRVNIVLGNSEYFRNDWNCSVSSKMSFNKTCPFW